MGNLAKTSDVIKKMDEARPIKPGSVIEVFNDGSIRFLPEKSKSEAKYRDQSDGKFDESYDRCHNCVHYIEHGGCHLVDGEISPNHYCEEYFADIGVFSHKHENYIETNLAQLGDIKDWSISDVKEFMEDIRISLGDKVK